MHEDKQHALSPATTVKNKTGSWKLSEPVHDHEICIGCNKCVLFCPDSCTFKIEKKNAKGMPVTDVDLDYCKGCGLCAAVCPVKAIKMVSIEKKS